MEKNESSNNIIEEKLKNYELEIQNLKNQLKISSDKEKLYNISIDKIKKIQTEQEKLYVDALKEYKTKEEELSQKYEEYKQDLEKKIERAYKWIDYVDFLKTFNSAFSSGLRFQTSEIVTKLKIDADLETKLDSINKDNKS